MTFSGAARYPSEDGFRDVADWVYARCHDPGFDVEAFATGDVMASASHGDIYRQFCFVFLDNLVHFFWFIRRLAQEGIDPVAYLVREKRLLPAYHSSGLYATLYVAGCADWEDVERVAMSAGFRTMIHEAELWHMERDIRELRAIDPNSCDPITRDAVEILKDSARRFYSHVSDGAEVVERVFQQTTGEVSVQDRAVLQQLLKGRLACLSGYGPRPYMRGDVDRLLSYCSERGINVEFSVINGPDLHVIGGSALHVARAEVIARRGLAGRVPFLVSKVLVDGAPHTSRFKRIAEQLKGAVDRSVAGGLLRAPAIPFVGRNRQLVVTVEDVREEVLHLLDQVYDFQGSCQTAIHHGARWFMTGLSGELSSGRRVVRANLMDAAMAMGAFGLSFASTDARGARSQRERAAMLDAFLADAKALGAVGKNDRSLDALDRLRESWEAGLRARQSADGSCRKADSNRFMGLERTGSLAH